MAKCVDNESEVKHFADLIKEYKTKHFLKNKEVVRLEPDEDEPTLSLTRELADLNRYVEYLITKR